MIRLSILILLISSSLFSQFGKNKVQYERFDWKFIESPNFDVYFHEGGEYLAKFTAIEAEKALKEIESTLSYKLINKISIVAFNTHNQFQQNNVIDQFLSEGIGGVTQIYKNRIVIQFQGSYAQFRHLIHHELVHGVLNDMFHGGTLQASISQGGYFIPTWLNEGFAEYSSLRGMDVETDMFMRDLTISKMLPNLDQISGYLSYRAGQTFYWYVADKYGPKKVGEFMNRLRNLKSVEAAFETSFGMDLEQFSDRWTRDIEKYYWPELEKFEDVTEFAEEVTNREDMRNFYNSSPSISPDGEKMAFISESGGLLGISVMDIDDQESKRDLVSSFRSQDFEDLNILTPGISWNPDGTLIAVSAKSGGEDAIYIIEEESGDYQKILPGFKSIASVNWSNDGKKLAFIGLKHGASDIYTYELQSKKLEQITNDVFAEEYPIWSPDSRSIYFISDRGDNLKNVGFDFSMWSYDFTKSDVYRVSLDFNTIERLTDTPEFKKTSIAIGPNEEKLLFVSDQNGINNLYELYIPTGNIKPKTNSISAINHISLSKDGSKLLFGSQMKAGYDIYLMRFPFQNDLEDEKLPLTHFRENNFKNDENDLIVQNLIKDQKQEEPISYGDFIVDFENDKLVEPNQDAIVNLDNRRLPSKIDTNFKVQDYKLKFTPDLIYGQPSYNTFFGVQGVTQAMLSDEMGEHRLTLQFNLLQDTRNSTFIANYSYLPEVTDYSLTGYHTAAFANNFGTGALERFRIFGLSGRASRPFDLFNRLEYSIDLMNAWKEDVRIPQNPDVRRFMIVNEIRFVHDNSLGGLYAPIIGSRYNIRIFGTPQIGNDGIGFITAKFDGRYYFRATPWINFAMRASGGISHGFGDYEGLRFRLGGTENWINSQFVNGNRFVPFDDPEDVAFMNFEMPMRGWTVSELSGNKYFLSNLEMRFPLFQALVAGPVPILIQGVQGAFFLDYGAAWSDEFVAEFYQRGFDQFNNPLSDGSMLMSSGIGARSILFGLPLKLDVAWRYNGIGWSTPQYVVSFGFDW